MIHHLGRWKIKSCTQLLHAVVARSRFGNQKIQNTAASEHFWNLRCWKVHGVVARTRHYATPYPRLHDTTLHYTTLYYTIHYTTAHDTTRQDTTRRYTTLTLRYTTWHYIYIALHCMTLHYITLHYSYTYNYTYTTTTQSQLQLHLHYNYMTATTTTTLRYSYYYTRLYNYTTLQLPHTTLHDATLHCTASNHLAIHQWIRSAIFASHPLL